MRKTLASSLVAGAFLLLYSAAIVQAFESHLKMRIHKDFVQNLYTKNFDLLLSKIEKEQEKDAWLEEINAKLTDLHIGIRPVGNKKWEQIAPFETFFDESQIVLEGHDLEFQGRGMIQDPETQALEIVAFHAPMSTCQIVVSLSEQYESWGSLYPRFNIDQVHFSLDENLLSVSTFGELPLYKSHNFEKVVKKWFISQVTKRQSEFKSSLQAVEKNVWKNAPFSEKLFAGRVTLNNSLAESLRIQDDYLLASFLNEFDHQMDADFEEKLVVVNPSFSDANDFKKDVQLTFDENLVNNHFQALFNSNKAISVQETVIGWLPDTVQKYARVLSAFFNTIYFAKLFPDLSLEFGVNRMLDIKCGFSKAFLSDKLTEKHTSQIWFKEGNIVDFSFNFGCGIFVGPPPDSNILNVFQSMMGQVNEDEQPKRDQKWSPFRSFFIALHGSTELEFNPSSFFQGEHFMAANFKTFDFNMREFKVFKGSGSQEHEMLADEESYLKLINNAKSFLVGLPVFGFLNKFPFLQGIPMSPFPKYQRCMGITPIQGHMQILDRFMRVGFNVKLEKADESCLYEDFQKKPSETKSFFDNFNLADITEGYNKLTERRNRKKVRDLKNDE